MPMLATATASGTRLARFFRSDIRRLLTSATGGTALRHIRTRGSALTLRRIRTRTPRTTDATLGCTALRHTARRGAALTAAGRTLPRRALRHPLRSSLRRTAMSVSARSVATAQEDLHFRYLPALHFQTVDYAAHAAVERDDPNNQKDNGDSEHNETERHQGNRR